MPRTTQLANGTEFATGADGKVFKFSVAAAERSVVALVRVRGLGHLPITLYAPLMRRGPRHLIRASSVVESRLAVSRVTGLIRFHGYFRFGSTEVLDWLYHTGIHSHLYGDDDSAGVVFE